MASKSEVSDIHSQTKTNLKSSWHNMRSFSGKVHCVTIICADAYLSRITWVPVVLSFSFTAKELKANPLVPICQKLEGLDIKVLPEYIRNKTTHVVAKKRNTSKGLQALINGKYIVDHTFIDVVLEAAEPNDDEVSALEEDFDLNWPDPLGFLPPRGAEPTQRPADTYGPDASRQTFFEGYTFVFYEQAQFENLLPPITNGGGKALLRAVEPGSTDPDDFIRYVKNVAGEKGVVVVRFQPSKGPALPWYQDFVLHVSINLDHRLVEQNEFLDAILNNDASVLRKPLEIESSVMVPQTIMAACELVCHSYGQL